MTPPPATAASPADHAATALDQALRLTAEARSKQLRRVCLAAVAPVLAGVAEATALGLAATLEDEDRRQSVLADIAVAVAATDLRRAVDSVRDFHEAYRAKALADIVKAEDPRRPGNGTYVLDTYILGAAPPAGWSPQSAAEFASAVAEFAPDRAEEIAAGIDAGYSRTVALAGVARSVAATDPGRALRLLPDRYDPWAAPAVAEAVALVDPDRALSLVASLADRRQRPHALAGVARSVAATDPDRAVRIADGITDRAQRAEALAAAAAAVAVTGPGRALEVISMIGDRDFEEAARADLALVVAAHAPDRAVRLAEGLAVRGGDVLWRVLALAGVASVLLGTGQRRTPAVRLAAGRSR
ncbi:hypothetical protein [Kitasatospora sp. McL0602]|uniref:hypothetical protein n=1 Tax=Kitasatospora sp. McL0602 TaxID=3439530 RepID=UPI003F8B3D74